MGGRLCRKGLRRVQGSWRQRPARGAGCQGRSGAPQTRPRRPEGDPQHASARRHKKHRTSE
eukprot:scaffold84774_cov26-Prasinocladus_malaysianus.AAC.1